MQDPIMRVLTTLEILQARDHVTGAELAERLEVDLRTVQRYIVRLRDLNIPVDASPGVGGSYRLRPGFRLPPLLLTNEEAFALSLGLRALRQIGLEAFAPATEGALAKLGRVLPAALRENIQTVEEIVALEPSSWMVSTPAETLMTAAAAIRTSHRVCFAYSSYQGTASQREIEPYAVLHTDDRWYLIGRCLERQAIRAFRLDRVTQLQLSTTTFPRPESFDARQYLAEHLPFVQSEYRIDLWIDLPIEEAHRSFALWRMSMEEQDHGTRVRCGRDTLDFFAAMLLSTRRRIVVHTPVELREVFQALALEAMQAAGRLGKRRIGETMKPTSHPNSEAASANITKRIQDLGGWRGETLARVRQLIHDADPAIQEEWKWAKPTSPGTPVWSHDGIVCTGELYKQVVKLTFARGASIKDLNQLFNSSLEGNTRRAIDLREGDTIDEAAFRQLIRDAVTANAAALAQRAAKKK